MAAGADPFGAKSVEVLGGIKAKVSRLDTLERAGLTELARLPYSIRVLLENLLRNAGDGFVTEDDVLEVAKWSPSGLFLREIPFRPTRVLLQDFTGVPCVVDLAALRSAVARLGGEPCVVDPAVPVDLIVDHSVQVDFHGAPDALARNMALEIERNRERYELLRWSQEQFERLTVFPPGVGICHQVNLEFLSSVVSLEQHDGEFEAFPGTVIGTDSHTTMINGLGVLGWGVGGIEAEAVMLGRPYFMLPPSVVGVRLTGRLRPKVTATDLVLTLTELLRSVGVVGRFVEYFGPGCSTLSLPDRATVANMAPEYGATTGFFPVDRTNLDYMLQTNRSAQLIARVEAYCRLQGLFRGDEGVDPDYSDVVELDLAEVEPSLAGPKRPQDRVPLARVGDSFTDALPALAAAAGRETGEPREAEFCLSYGSTSICDGAVVIAAITSCTNTSNPAAMITAALVARNAVEHGLAVKPWVKTSLAPGSRVVTEYLKQADLLAPLEALGFHVVGYGCSTCIGNSGPLEPVISEAIQLQDLAVAAVVSGNRNFEGRVHPLVRANYLASPGLVVAFALAGTVSSDLTHEPLGRNSEGTEVFLADVWPSDEEVEEILSTVVRAELYKDAYAEALEGDRMWAQIPVPEGDLFRFDPDSTYVREPPFLEGVPPEPEPLRDIEDARILGIFGDSVTTDHISPAGSIPVDGPAGTYLVSKGVKEADFNTFGARRGNHEVMMRGTFANVRIRNHMLHGKEGGLTVLHPSGRILPIFDAAMAYAEEEVPLVVFAGKEYGTGSSRDYAAKGPALLGVRAVIAESFERIHRGNLVGMGILPLEFAPGENAAILGLTGEETISVLGIRSGPVPRATLQVEADGVGGLRRFSVTARLDSEVEVEYYRHGGILPRVLRQLIGEASCGGHLPE